MRNPQANDDGVSLVEVLIAVVILGICFAGLIAGLGSAVLSSGVHRDQADGHSLLVSVGEAVKDPVRNPFSCTSSTYKLLEDGDGNAATNLPLPSGWAAANVTLANVESGYWGGTGFVTAACGAGTDLQRITLIAESPDDRVREELVVLKRRP